MSSGRHAYRNQHEAVQAFLAPLNLTMSCVTKDTLVRSADERRPRWGRLSFRDDITVPLASPHRLSLKILHLFELTEDHGSWSASTRLYLYHVFAADM